MASTTSRFALPYPGLTDAPNGPVAFQALAEDVDDQLARAFICTSGTRPTGVGDGFLIRETDSGKVYIRNATGSSWDELTAAGGGGGGSGFDAVEGEWTAASNQSLTSATETVIAFGTTATASALVTRATSGAGHKFTLAEDGCYAVTAVVRFGSGAAGSRFLALRNNAQTAQYITAQNDGGPAAATRNFSIVRRFSAGADLVVIGSQSSGGSLSTVALGVTPAVPYTKIVIVKLTD